MIKSFLINFSIGLITKYYNQLVSEINSENFTKKKLLYFYKKIYFFKKIVISSGLQSPEFYYWLKSSDLIVLNFKNYYNNSKKIFELQSNLLNNNNYEILEPSFILQTIGSSFTVDALIKSIKLNLYPKRKIFLPINKKLKSEAQNLHLLNYYKKYIYLIDDDTTSKKIIKKIYNYRCWHNVTINIQNNFMPLSHPSCVFIEKKWKEKKYEPLFSLTKEDLINGKKILQKMGLSENSWYVIVHVRNSNFKGKEGFRDSKIEDFYESFDYITSRGGYIIRMGEKNLKPLPKIKNVLDYATSEFKSDFMDIFFCASAKFILGTSSGLSAISYIFGVPVAMTNYLPLATIYLGKQDIFLPRLMRFKNNNKYLTFNQLTSKPYTLGITDGMYTNLMGVETIPNTPDEIKELAREMYLKISKDITYSNEEKKLHEKFKKLTIKNVTLYGIEESIPIQCQISNYFIKKHSNLLK